MRHSQPLAIAAIALATFGCGSARYNRLQQECFDNRDKAQLPLEWQADWSPPRPPVFHDWRLTLGTESSNDLLPWVSHLDGADVWFGPSAFEAALQGRLAYPAPEPYQYKNPAVRRRLANAVENYRRGAEPEVTGRTYVLMALLLTGKVAVQDSHSGEFVPYIHVLRLGWACGGLSGGGEAGFYLPQGVRFLHVGEWES